MCTADDGCSDFSLMVDEPLNIASSRWMPDAEVWVAVAQGVRNGPLVDEPRVCAVDLSGVVSLCCQRAGMGQ